MGVFLDALARGTDQTQAMLYGFASVIGEQTGFDALAEWGEEGTLRNLAEAAENPPRVESFDDINSLADLGDYVVEALGENATSLLAMIIPAVGAGAMAGKIGAETLARATIGKAVRQKIGAEAFETFAKKRAQNIAASTAAGASSFGLNTGESYLNLTSEGVDDASGTALVSGAIKAGLDVFGVQRIFSAAAKVGATPRDFMDYTAGILQQTKMAGTAEAVTEGLQTVVDMAALSAEKPDFDFWDVENLKDVVNASLKGGIAGGTFGGAGHAIANFQEYRKGAQAAKADLEDAEQVSAQRRAALDDFTARLLAPVADAERATETITPPIASPAEDEQRTLEEDSLPLPESASAILSQVRALVDPENPKRAVLVTPGSTMPDSLPDGVESTPFTSRDGNENLLLTYEPEVTEQVRAQQTLTEENLGELLYDRPQGKPDNPEEAVVVRGEDATGATVTEVATDADNVNTEIAKAEEQAETVQTESPRLTVNRRIAELASEQTGQPLPDDIPDVMGLVAQLPESYQREVVSAMRSSNERARQMAAGLTRTVQQGPETVQATIDAAYQEERAALEAEEAETTGALGPAEDIQSELDQDLAARVAERGDEATLRGNGFSTAEIADRQLAALNEREPDPNMIRDVAEQDGRFFIREQPLTDPALQPELTGSTNVARGRQEGASESRIVNQTLQKARKTGKDRAKLHRATDEPLARNRVRDSYLRIKNPSGTEQPMTVADLVTGGTSLLNARGQTVAGESQAQRDNLALETMLGEMAARGYDVSAAVRPDGKLRRGIITRADNIKGDGPVQRTRDAERRQAEGGRVRETDTDTPIADEVGSQLETEQGVADGGSATDVREAATLTRQEQEQRARDADRDTREELKAKRRARRISARMEKLASRSANGQITSWGETITQPERDFVEAILRDVGLTDVTVRVIDTTTLNGGLGYAIVGDGRASILRQRFRDEPGLQAVTFRTRSGPVIVVRDDLAGPQKLLTLGHETGHQILHAAWEGLKKKPAIQKRLRAAYEKEKSTTPVEQWLGSKGIGEWFADKVAARARVLSNRPANAVDKVFRDVARQLEKFWKALGKRLPERFKYNKSFDAAMREMKNEEIFDSSALFVDTPAGQEESIVIDTSQMKDHVSRATLKDARDKLKQFVNGLSSLPVSKHLFTVDQRLRAMSEPLADMLYQQSNTEQTIESFHGAVSYQRSKWMGHFFSILRKHSEGKTDAYIKNAFEEAGSDTPTAELKTELARDVRKMLYDYYKDYLKPRMEGLDFVENYFPRSYNRSLIAQQPDQFTEMLVRHGIEQEVAEKMTDHLRMKETQHRFDSDEEMQESWQRERVIVGKPELIKELLSEGYLNKNPIGGLQAYIYDTTRKAEWDRLFAGHDEKGKYNPNLKLRQEIDKLPKEQRAEAARLVFLSVYPHHGDPTNPWHRALSELKAYESFRVLLMSGVASVPEMAGLILRTKGQMPFGEIREHIMDTVTNYQEARETAVAMGVVRDMLGESMATEIYFDPMMEDGKGFFRKHLPHLFRWNGNDFIVNLSRTAGVGLGRAFLMNLAPKALKGDADAVRMLKELGVKDPQSIMRWAELNYPPSAVGLSDLDTIAVDEALAGLNRYIDESVIHPNASERPAWAGHPVGGLIFHLKAFAMTYNKVVMEGVYREMEHRLDKGGVKDGVVYLPFLMGAFGIFVLMGAISDELRNRILTLGEKGTIEKHRGDVSDMVTKWVDRAGFMSQPWNDLLTADDLEGVAYGLGPTAHHAYEIALEDYGTYDGLVKALKATPGLSQAPELRKDALQDLTD